MIIIIIIIIVSSSICSLTQAFVVGVPLLTVVTLAIYDYELFGDDHPA